MKYITFEIKNKEPIKQADTIGQKDNEFAKGYISGSNLRGAFIANYIKIKQLNDIKDIHSDRLLKDGITFFNAYPICDSIRTLPIPKCYFAIKDDIKNLRYSKNMNIYLLEDTEGEDNDYDKVSEQNFAKWDFRRKELEMVSVGKSSNIHINKGFDKNKIFRYESINPGNEFFGIIACKEDEFAEECVEILKNGLFYIGGSKGSGYGLCEFTNYYISDENPESKYFKAWAPESEDKEITIVALSDIAYRGENGVYSSFVPEQLIKNKLGLNDVVLIDSFMENEYITGYNNKWGYRLANIKGIKAGSTFVYKINGDIEENKLQVFINESIGERVNEGFGRIAVISSLQFKNIRIYHEGKPKIKFDYSLVTAKEKEDLSIISNRIYRQKLKSKISDIVLNLSDNIKNENCISSSQWEKLMSLMKIIEPLNCNEGIEKIKNYFDNINNKKINRKLKNNFEKVSIKGTELQKYIIYELEDQDISSFESHYLNSITLGDVQSQITIQSIYTYKINIFKELFRLKKGITEGGRAKYVIKKLYYCN